MGQKPSFSGCFSLQLARNSRPKSHFAPTKSVGRGVFVWSSPEFRLLQARKKRKAGVFHLTTDGAISKRGRFYPNTSTRTKKHKAITKKPKDKIKKQTFYTEKTKHKQAREIVFLSLPHSTQKIQADFLSKLLHFSRLPPLFLSKPPHPAQNPFHPTRRTRAYAYIRARALSEFAIFAFTLHLTAQQTVYQPVEGEGKPCIHLHLHRNKLKNNILHDIRCQKQVKEKG